jgi:hypothetical protein
VTFRISINPYLSDVQLNIEYARTQLGRAMKKAAKHHPERKRMMWKLQAADATLAEAWALAKGPP